jgi:hypothetical protein
MNVHPAVLPENCAYGMTPNQGGHYWVVVHWYHRFIALLVEGHQHQDVDTSRVCRKCWLYIGTIIQFHPFLHLYRYLNIEVMGVNDMLDNAAGKAHKNHGESLRTFLGICHNLGSNFQVWYKCLHTSST